MAAPPRYVLDTNVLVAYCRGRDLGRYIEAKFSLLTVTQVPLLSIVCEGEIRAFARNVGWQGAKQRTLTQLLGRFVRINLDFPGIIEAYAEIDHASRYPASGSSREMGKNDLWIAATAKVTGAHLLTTDKDYDHLDGVHLTRHFIDPASRL